MEIESHNPLCPLYDGISLHLLIYSIYIYICACAQRGEERLEKTRQMELQLPELSYVVVPSFLLFLYVI